MNFIKNKKQPLSPPTSGRIKNVNVMLSDLKFQLSCAKPADLFEIKKNEIEDYYKSSSRRPELPFVV
jgi:hypothetical protein